MHVLKACLFFQPFKLFHHAIQIKMIYYLIHSHRETFLRGEHEGFFNLYPPFGIAKPQLLYFATESLLNITYIHDKLDFMRCPSTRVIQFY